MDSPITDNSKAAAGTSTPPVGFRPRGENGVIKVQPPRREDLQPSYAQTLQGDTEIENYGWYGSMSMWLSVNALRSL